MPTNQVFRWLKQHIRLTSIVGVLLLVILIGVLIFLVVAAPAVNKVFRDTVSVTCFYRGQAVAFLDKNGDGVQQPDEPGVAGVKLTVNHTAPILDQKTPEIWVSDSNGHLVFGSDANYCNSDDSLIVNVILPAGYTATTPLNLGPYDIPNWASKQPITRLPPIPTMIYVGLRQN
jgi:hypothetical protein